MAVHNNDFLYIFHSFWKEDCLTSSSFDEKRQKLLTFRKKRLQRHLLSK